MHMHEAGINLRRYGCADGYYMECLIEISIYPRGQMFEHVSHTMLLRHATHKKPTRASERARCYRIFINQIQAIMREYSNVLIAGADIVGDHPHASRQYV